MPLNNIPIYKIMSPNDTFDIVNISVIDALLNVLMARCKGNRYRLSRLQSMFDLLHKIEVSYEGYIPDEYINRSERFLKYMHTDLNSLIKDIKGVKSGETPKEG